MTEFIDICREKGLNVTYQRLLVYKTLRNSKNHPTAEEIYQQTKAEYPSISLATVYKTLELLAEQDLIGKVTPLHDLARYDGDMSLHHHLVCLSCRKVLDIHDDSLNNLQLPAQKDFDVSGYRIQFEGVCNGCKKKQRKKVFQEKKVFCGHD